MLTKYAWHTIQCHRIHTWIQETVFLLASIWIFGDDMSREHDDTVLFFILFFILRCHRFVFINTAKRIDTANKPKSYSIHQTQSEKKRTSDREWKTIIRWVVHTLSFCCDHLKSRKRKRKRKRKKEHLFLNIFAL